MGLMSLEAAREGRESQLREAQGLKPSNKLRPCGTAQAVPDTAQLRISGCMEVPAGGIKQVLFGQANGNQRLAKRRRRMISPSEMYKFTSPMPLMAPRT